MTTFKIIAFTPDDFERTVYVSTEKQVRQFDADMKERMSFTQNCNGHVLDPSKYPEGTRFLIVTEKE
jgi:hypothetical protein